MEPVVVVGAGMAGVAAARALARAGLPVVVLDRGRRIGGRMAVRTVADRPVDIGASYFTVADPAFRVVVEDWQQRGLARPWTDTFHVFDAASGPHPGVGDLSPKSGPMRWAAPRGLRSLVEDLAVGLDVGEQQVSRVEPGPMVDGQPAAAVVLAMPDPQAERLLDSALTPERAALTDPFAPVLALTATWSRRLWPDIVDGVFVSDDDALTWIADDGRRRGDSAPVLVAHSTADLAAQHLSDPAAATEPMVTSVMRVLSLPEPPASTHVHRWTFAKPAATRSEPYYLGESLVGLCGDSWSDKPRVEAAFLSGTALGHAIARHLAA